MADNIKNPNQILTIDQNAVIDEEYQFGQLNDESTGDIELTDRSLELDS